MPALLLPGARCFTFVIVNILFKASYYQSLSLHFLNHALPRKRATALFLRSQNTFPIKPKATLKPSKFNCLILNFEIIQFRVLRGREYLGDTHFILQLGRYLGDTHFILQLGVEAFLCKHAYFLAQS
ncbi:MAG: hypothetical protein COB04_18985 [Gammaproteobacteria bacterium]|nr:MAG: hypothetical protein COB04_18985 [Gammaproteobacteria bacterium]